MIRFERLILSLIILSLVAFIAAALLIPIVTGVNWVGDLVAEPLPVCYLGNDCAAGDEFKCEMRVQAVMYECRR